MAECPATLDGEHHYAPRKWLSRDAQGRSLDQLEPKNWQTVLACVCRQRPPNDQIVEEQLKATVAERQREKEIGARRRRIITEDPGKQMRMDI